VIRNGGSGGGEWLGVHVCLFHAWNWKFEVLLIIYDSKVDLESACYLRACETFREVRMRLFIH
jgi:hypothetical protein